MTSTTPQTPLLEARDISKQYPGVVALDAVSFTLHQGEIRALVGENGAGKSTFVNVIGGVVRPDSGSLYWMDNEVHINSPRDASQLGIAIVHQELSLFPNLDIASNLFISSLRQGRSPLVPDRQLRQRAEAILERVGLGHISPRRKAGSLQPGEQQLVEIGRSIVQDARLIVLDEPTSSLAEKEIQTLFRIVRDLRDQGVSIIFVTHRLDEVFEICTNVTVFRDGCHIDTVPTGQINTSGLVHMILGRQIREMYEVRETYTPGPELLRVDDLWQQPKLKGLGFSLHQGEILGIAGLLGSGRSEMVRAIFGLSRPERGSITLKGRPVTLRSPQQAIRHGIGYITEDRHKEGLVLSKPIKDNIVMAYLKGVATRWGWMRPAREREAAQRQKLNLNIITPSIERRVKFLSGGNQQKVVLGKWLETKPDIFIMDEPTRGIDVGAKAEFYRIITDLAASGAGILLISSELQEIVSICHRVLVLRSGRFVAEFAGEQINAADILIAMTGEDHE